jgi:fatty-acyl-CoA synthase
MEHVIPGLRDLAPCWLERLQQLWPDRPAVTDPDAGKDYTYRELCERSSQVAAGLWDLGVRKGDRVAALMQNGVPLLDLLFACGRLGAILVPLNWRLSERELAALMQDVEPVVVVADTEYVQTAHTTAPNTLVVDSRHSFAGAPEPPSVEVRQDDPWLILFTGGTTGTPKGAVLTHGSILWNAINTDVSWGLSCEDVGPSFTPMFHTGGLNVFTLPLLLLGGRVILPRRFDPAQALGIIEREKPTVLFFVPTMFRAVAEQPGFAAADLSHLRWAISGGAPLPKEVARMWQPKVRIFKQGYGLTEVGPNNFATSDDDALSGKQMSVGKLTFFASARIVDDEGTDVPEGEAGELLLAGPHMCAGYWRRPEATAEAMRAGWFHTGDVARRDADGFYYIVDRKKEMIITGGENVYPSEVEAILYEHAAVREAAVVGMPDPHWGEAVWAVVSLKPGEAVTPEDIRQHARANLAGYKAPKRVVIVDDVPKSVAGKIVRAEARALAETLERSPAAEGTARH